MNEKPATPIEAMYLACADVLALAATLPSVGDLPKADMLRQRLEQGLGRMQQLAVQSSIPAEDIDDARYALIAFLDEQVLRSPWNGRQDWLLEPLQLKHYNENTAGEGFFARLDRLREQPNRAHVLQVYTACLALGFQGKFAVQGGKGLQEQMERAFDKLQPHLEPAEPMSPAGVPTDVRRAAVRRDVPVIVLAAALLGAALVLFVVLKVMVVSSSHAAADHIRETTSQLRR